MPITSDDDIRALFDVEIIAVAGCSATVGKSAHDTPAYVQRHSYRVAPVNPFRGEILDEMAYDSLVDVDEDVDFVDVLRPSEEAGDIVDVAIERTAGHGDVEAVWLQLGIHDDDAVVRAEEAGPSFVQDKRLKIGHLRLV